MLCEGTYKYEAESEGYETVSGSFDVSPSMEDKMIHIVFSKN